MAKKANLQLICQAKFLHSPDEPLGRIILVPFDGVPVVHRELVVKIVITLSNGNEGGDHMIAGGVLIVERSLTKPVCKRVNTEGRLLVHW